MNELREEILELEKDLTEKKKQLFLKRLEKIAGCSFVDSGILSLNIVTDQDENTWQISYVHYTKSYNPVDYLYSTNTDSDNDVIENQEADVSKPEGSTPDKNEFSRKHKKTRIVFGKAAKYFIKGGVQLNIYRNTTGEIRITNPDYEFDLDLDEQRSLSRTYSENYNLPEWFAISVLLFMSDNKWDDDAIINHLSFV